MSSVLKIVPPEVEELRRRKRVLTGLQRELSAKELELSTEKVQVNIFRVHYQEVVGKVSSDLDKVKAQVLFLASKVFPRAENFKEEADISRNNAKSFHEKNPESEKPSKEFLNDALGKEKDLVAEHGSMDAYYDATPIKCKAIEKSEIFVTAEGHVFPCCWTAGQQYKWYWGAREAPIWKLIEDPDNISLRKHTIQEIVEGPFFKAIEDSWSCSSVKDGKLKVCANKCGVKFDAFGEQFT